MNKKILGVVIIVLVLAAGFFLMHQGKPVSKSNLSEVQQPAQPGNASISPDCMPRCIASGKPSKHCAQECGVSPGPPGQQPPGQQPGQQPGQMPPGQQPGQQPVQGPQNLPDPNLTEGFALGFMAIEQSEVSLLKESGANWVRRNQWFSPEGSLVTPGVSNISVFVEAGINLLNTIEPLAGQIPNDYTAFKKKLRELVVNEKKYVKYWQLGNEPDLIWKMQGSTEEDYVTFFLELQPVIREACPDCKIVLAGISNQYNSGNNYDYFKDVLTKIKSRSPDSRPFDAFDLHLYPFEGDYWRAENATQTYKALLDETGYGYDMEFISTEFGMYSGQPNDMSGQLVFRPESTQAKTLIKLYTMLFNGGVTKACWVFITNPYKFGNGNQNEGGIWDLVGLVYNGKGSYDLANNIAPGTKKESFYAYKTLASKLQGMVQSEKIADNVYKFSNSSGVVYVAWNDSGGKLPSQISGTIKVTDYIGNERTINSIDLDLTDSPVFIELL